MPDPVIANGIRKLKPESARGMIGINNITPRKRIALVHVKCY
jgi:hypothetical protein